MLGSVFSEAVVQILEANGWSRPLAVIDNTIIEWEYLATMSLTAYMMYGKW